MFFQKLLFAASLLSVTSFCKSFNVTISCTPCSESCGYLNCYKIKSQLFSSQACGQQNCVLNNELIMKIDKCENDFYGNSCSSGICFYPNTTGCIQTDLTAVEKAQFTVGTWNQISCGACTISNCTKCRISQKKGVTQALEQCLGSTCNGIQKVNITAKFCTNNSSPAGNPCQYCYSTSYLAKPLGICTNYNPKFSSYIFTAYAQVKTSQDKTSWQNLFKTINLIILCYFMVAFN